MNQENQVEISNKIMDIVETAAKIMDIVETAAQLSKDIRENESAVGWVKRVLKARKDAQDAFNEIIRLAQSTTYQTMFTASQSVALKWLQTHAGTSCDHIILTPQEVEEDTGKEDLRAHIIAEDPRYPTLCINGKFTYGMSMNPVTGDVDPTRHCICHARTDDECICDLQ